MPKQIKLTGQEIQLIRFAIEAKLNEMTRLFAVQEEPIRIIMYDEITNYEKLLKRFRKEDQLVHAERYQ